MGLKALNRGSGGGAGTVTSVTASGPLASSGGTTPNISLTGIVAAANGGTGSAFFTVAGPSVARVYTFPDQAATILYSGGDAGTPSALVGTNITGTASGLTAGNATLAATVTTNANLTGPVTSVGNATAIANGAIAVTATGNSGQVLTSNGSGAAPTFQAAAGGGATLNGITAATGAVTIASGNNTGIVWNWANTTNTTVAFTFGETSAATNGTADGQILVKINTLAASTQIPLQVAHRGATAFQVGSNSTPTGAVFAEQFSFLSASNQDAGLGHNASGNGWIKWAGVQIVRFTDTNFKLIVGSSTAPSVTDQTSANTGLYWPATNTLGIANVTTGEILRFVGGTASGAQILFGGCTFANLGTPANGSMAFCSDCDPPALFNSTCASAGAKTGAFAQRINGAWIC